MIRETEIGRYTASMSPAILLQYLLPHRFLSRIVRHATRWGWAPWKNFLIRTVVRKYAVAMEEAVPADPVAYPTFDAFFTRALRPDARLADPDPEAILCPADGKISRVGRIESGRIIQAKGQHFSVQELLGDTEIRDFDGGWFATVYLSPRDYHRVHMPLGGSLLSTVHVPGRLFSVAPFAVRAIPRLFARNERLVCHFSGSKGRFAVVMVGAMLVSGVETVWGGEVIPPYGRNITRQDCQDRAIQLARFAEMARFHMGSTVIVLLPPDAEIDTLLAPEQAVQLGQRIGRWRP